MKGKSKRSHKLRALGDVAAVVRSAPSLTEAAKRLGVNYSTLYRWMESGKVLRQQAKQGGPSAVEVPPDSQTAEEWATKVRAELGEVSATQEELVQAGQLAINLSRDTTLGANVRLSAVRTFQVVARDLRFEAPAAKPAVSVRPQRTGTDPRAVLMAVK